MKVLYIMPWFTRPSAMSKHCKIFLSNAISLGINPIVVSLNGKDDFKENHDYLPIKDYSNKYVAALFRRLFPDIVNVPDVYNYGTVQMGVKTILKKINFEEIEYIHTVSFPCSSHLMGYELAKKTGKPWIAQFYDPWTDNPYRKIETTFFRKKDAAMERLIAENASAIIHTNDVIKEIWRERYGERVAQKMFVQPMSYENEVYSNVESISKRTDKPKVTISYIGKLFFDRNLDDIINAIKILRDKGVDVQNKIALKVIGEATSHDIANIKNSGLEKVVEVVGYLPQSQLKQYYIDSDAFLVIDSPQSKNVFFPSKLLDYFLYKRLIIGITPEVGVTSELIKKSSNIKFENGHCVALADYLLKLINDHSLLDSFDKDFYENFSPMSLQKTYKSIINYICQH